MADALTCHEVMTRNDVVHTLGQAVSVHDVVPVLSEAADVNADVLASTLASHLTSIVEALPSNLEHESLLRVQSLNLFEGHGREDVGINAREVNRVVIEIIAMAGAGCSRAPVCTSRVVPVDVEAGLGGADPAVLLVHQKGPEVLRGSNPARETAGHAADGDRCELGSSAACAVDAGTSDIPVCPQGTTIAGAIRQTVDVVNLSHFLPVCGSGTEAVKQTIH